MMSLLLIAAHAAHAAPPVGFEAAWRRAAVTFAQHIQPDMSEANTWGVDGPPGATGVLSRGVPPVKGVWGAAPGSPPQAPIFWGFFD